MGWGSGGGWGQPHGDIPQQSGEGKDDWVPAQRANHAWQPPGHDRMFNSHEWESDNPGRSFTTRKKHGWWGREEYFDKDGKKIG